MNLDERWVYKFIRTDLPFKQHSIQLGHASWHAGAKFGAKYGEQSGIPFSVEVGMPNTQSLARVVRKLTEAGIEFFLFTDTDVSPQPSALVTEPVDAATRNKYFSNYRLYSPGGAAQTAGLNADRGASSCLGAQNNAATEIPATAGAEAPSSRSSVEAEHRPLRPEVAGSIPAVSSSLPCD